MRLLLDTHAFLWYITNDPKLPRHAFDAIRDKSNEVYLSVVSVWEALVKHQIGKLTLGFQRMNISIRVESRIELRT
jgi:PIN domain nuclease of toxin-antitoxin system